MTIGKRRVYSIVISSIVTHLVVQPPHREGGALSRVPGPARHAENITPMSRYGRLNRSLQSRIRASGCGQSCSTSGFRAVDDYLPCSNRALSTNKVLCPQAQSPKPEVPQTLRTACIRPWMLAMADGLPCKGSSTQ